MTSTYDTWKISQDHSKNSYHMMCQIFTKICVTRVKGLKYVIMSSIFTSHLNWQLFWRTKLKMSKKLGNFPKLIGGQCQFWSCWILNILVSPLDVIKFRYWAMKWWRDFVGSIQSRKFWVSKNADPQMLFTGMKKCLKVFMLYGQCILPMKVRWTVEQDLHVKEKKFFSVF